MTLDNKNISMFAPYTVIRFLAYKSGLINFNKIKGLVRYTLNVVILPSQTRVRLLIGVRYKDRVGGYLRRQVFWGRKSVVLKKVYSSRNDRYNIYGVTTCRPTEASMLEIMKYSTTANILEDGSLH